MVPCDKRTTHLHIIYDKGKKTLCEIGFPLLLSTLNKLLESWLNLSSVLGSPGAVTVGAVVTVPIVFLTCMLLSIVVSSVLHILSLASQLHPCTVQLI